MKSFDESSTAVNTLPRREPPLDEPAEPGYFFTGKTTDGQYFFGEQPTPAACREACRHVALLYFICTPQPQETADVHQI